MSDLTIAVVGTEHFIVKGDIDTAKAYFATLGITPTQLFPADAAPDMSDVLVKAVACAREHGNSLEAFYASLPLQELQDTYSEADLCEIFRFAVQLNQAAGPSNDLVRELCEKHSSGEKGKIVKELRELFPQLSLGEAVKLVRNCIDQELQTQATV
jgi:hypothetical protein